MSEKMTLWNQVCKTDPQHTKRVSKGKFTITAVDAYYQISTATNLWGPFGGTWGVSGEKYERVTDNIMLYTAILRYPEGSVPLMADCELMVSRTDKRTNTKYQVYNDDWSKKLATDALTKGLSKLGFNVDVFFGLFDDNKYVQQRNQEVRQEQVKSGAQEIASSAMAQKAANDVARNAYLVDYYCEHPMMDKAGIEYIKRNGLSDVALTKLRQNAKDWDAGAATPHIPEPIK